MSSSRTPATSFETGSLVGLELPSPSVLLSSSPSPEPGLHVGTGNGTQDFMRVRQALYRLSHLPGLGTTIARGILYYSLTMSTITAAVMVGVTQLCSDLTILP